MVFSFSTSEQAPARTRTSLGSKCLRTLYSHCTHFVHTTITKITAHVSRTQPIAGKPTPPKRQLTDSLSQPIYSIGYGRLLQLVLTEARHVFSFSFPSNFISLFFLSYSTTKKHNIQPNVPSNLRNDLAVKTHQLNKLRQKRNQEIAESQKMTFFPFPGLAFFRFERLRES